MRLISYNDGHLGIVNEYNADGHPVLNSEPSMNAKCTIHPSFIDGFLDIKYDREWLKSIATVNGDFVHGINAKDMMRHYAAIVIQQYVINRLYKPPCGLMYKRLSSDYNYYLKK